MQLDQPDDVSARLALTERMNRRCSWRCALGVAHITNSRDLCSRNFTCGSHLEMMGVFASDRDVEVGRGNAGCRAVLRALTANFGAAQFVPAGWNLALDVSVAWRTAAMADSDAALHRADICGVGCKSERR